MSAVRPPPAPPRRTPRPRRALAAAVEAARAEILELSHRIHADPEPAFEEHHAATWVAEALRGHGFEVEHPAGSLATAIRASAARRASAATARGSASSPSTTRCRVSATAAATTRWPRPGSAPPSPSPSLADELPGEIVFLGTPAEERGSGKQIMIEDGLFDGLDAALLYHPCDRNHVESHPLASEDVDVVFTGLQAHASSDPWRGKNALDAMILLFSSVGLWRQQLRPDGARPRDHPRGRHGRQHHPGPHLGVVHDPQRRRGATTRTMRERFRELCEAAALATGTTRRGRPSPACATTMRNNPVLAERFRANMAAYGIDDQGDDPNAGSTDMANVSWVCPTIHPDLAIAPEGTPGPLDPVPRRGRDAPRRRDRPCSRPRSSPRPRRPVRRPGARRRGLGGVPRGLTRAGRQRRVLPSAPARPAGRRSRTGGAPSETDSIRTAVTPRPSPEDPVADRPHDPARPRLRARTTAGMATYETYDDFDLPTYVGPDDVHEAAVGHRPGRAAPARRRRGDRRRAVRRRGEPPTGRALRAAGHPRGAVHVGLDQLAPARRRAVRGPDRRRRRRRQHRPGLDRARRTR